MNNWKKNCAESRRQAKNAIEPATWTQQASEWMCYSAVALLIFLAIPFLFGLAGAK